MELVKLMLKFISRNSLKQKNPTGMGGMTLPNEWYSLQDYSSVALVHE